MGKVFAISQETILQAILRIAPGAPVDAGSGKRMMGSRGRCYFCHFPTSVGASSACSGEESLCLSDAIIAAVQGNEENLLVADRLFSFDGRLSVFGRADFSSCFEERASRVHLYCRPSVSA